jgi:hypothetical protein
MDTTKLNLLHADIENKSKPEAEKTVTSQRPMTADLFDALF